MASLQQIMIAGILLVGLFAGSITLYGLTQDNNVAEGYFNKIAVDQKYFNTTGINESSETYDVALRLSKKLNETASDTSNLDVNVVGAITASKILFNMADLIKETITIIAINMQVPDWIVMMILGILIVIVTGTIISLITGRQTE